MRAFFPPRPPMPMTLLRSLLSLALAAVTTPLLADTVWLKNGDKLTGSIELFDSGKLLLKTDYAGTITLDAGKIATVAGAAMIIASGNRLNPLSAIERGERATIVGAIIGAAILGYQEGDAIDWRIADRTRRIEIRKVLYQPEAAGDYHL